MVKKKTKTETKQKNKEKVLPNLTVGVLGSGSFATAIVKMLLENSKMPVMARTTPSVFVCFNCVLKSAG